MHPAIRQRCAQGARTVVQRSGRTCGRPPSAAVRIHSVVLLLRGLTAGKQLIFQQLVRRLDIVLRHEGKDAAVSQLNRN